MRRIVALTSVFVLALTLVPQSAHAATPVKSITLSPSSTTITIEPPVSANRNITIINDGDTPYSVNLSVAPYRVQGESYDPVFTRTPGTTDASQWVALSQKSLTLEAHKSGTVDYTVSAPSNTAAGGYYAIIFAETAGSSDGGVSARNRVGNILYITVDGQITQAGTLTDGGTPGFTFGNQTTLTAKVKNDGGVHFKSDVHFTVKNLFGSTALDTTASRYVLPQTTRLITQDFSPNGVGGIYKVSRSATVAGQQKALPDSWIVIIRPQLIPLLIFGLLTLTGFIVLFRRTRKTKNRR